MRAAWLPRSKREGVSAGRDLGDRACCSLLVVAALTGFALLGWYVWQMPGF